MTIPTIHMNGTNRNRLLDDICGATNALREAIRKLCETGPNGRDYYPQGPDAFRAAQAEHQSRLERLGSVQTELEALALAIFAAPEGL